MVVFLAAAVGLLIAANNREEPLPTQARLSESLESGIAWLHANKHNLLANENPSLWYFVQRSAQLSGDPRLAALVDAHRKKYIDPQRGNYLWEAMFNPGEPGLHVDFDAVVGLSELSRVAIFH